MQDISVTSFRNKDQSVESQFRHKTCSNKNNNLDTTNLNLDINNNVKNKLFIGHAGNPANRIKKDTVRSLTIGQIHKPLLENAI